MVMAGSETRRPTGAGRRAAALITLKIAVSAALIAWLIGRIGLESLLQVIGRADPVYLMGAAALLAASHLVGSWQWGRLLHLSGVPLSAGRVIAYYFAGAFGNLVLPTGAGGDVGRIIGVTRERGRAEAVVGATLLDRLLGLGVIGLLALLALNGARGIGRAPGGPWVIGAVVANAALSFGVLALVISPWGWRLLGTIGRRLPQGLAARLSRLREALQRVRVARRRELLIVAALGVQSIRILAHYQVARALDIDLSVRYFFLFVPLLAVAVSLPISIGGIGVRESMGAFLFGLLGIGPAEASGMQLLAYIVAICVGLPGAAIILAGRTHRRATPDVSGASSAPETELGR
jgi:uncharacterized membrane protein YbhN (UPF0104 family)